MLPVASLRFVRPRPGWEKVLTLAWRARTDVDGRGEEDQDYGWHQCLVNPPLSELGLWGRASSVDGFSVRLYALYEVIQRRTSAQGAPCGRSPVLSLFISTSSPLLTRRTTRLTLLVQQSRRRRYGFWIFGTTIEAVLAPLFPSSIEFV
jgi:hypothetical protein